MLNLDSDNSHSSQNLEETKLCAHFTNPKAHTQNNLRIKLLQSIAEAPYTLAGIVGDSLVRLNPDGSVDPDFLFDRVFGGRVAIQAMAIQTDGDILRQATSNVNSSGANADVARVFGAFPTSNFAIRQTIPFSLAYSLLK